MQLLLMPLFCILYFLLLIYTIFYVKYVQSLHPSLCFKSSNCSSFEVVIDVCLSSSQLRWASWDLLINSCLLNANDLLKNAVSHLWIMETLNCWLLLIKKFFTSFITNESYEINAYCIRITWRPVPTSITVIHIKTIVILDTLLIPFIP